MILFPSSVVVQNSNWVVEVDLMSYMRHLTQACRELALRQTAFQTFQHFLTGLCHDHGLDRRVFKQESPGFRPG